MRRDKIYISGPISSRPLYLSADRLAHQRRCSTGASFARCLGLTALYEQKRKPLGNVPAPTHVLTPEKKTSKKHKKTK